jgi:hypothetical protein
MHMNKTLSPPSLVRVTVPVTPEVLEAFQRLAKAGNMSTGKAMASWLEDTLDGVTYMASTMERARAAPKLVAQELHAYALGLADETGDLMQKVRAMGVADRARASSPSASAGMAPVTGRPDPVPPSCNTGGKLSKTPATPKKGNSRSAPLPPAMVQAYADTNGVPPKAPK